MHKTCLYLCLCVHIPSLHLQVQITETHEQASRRTCHTGIQTNPLTVALMRRARRRFVYGFAELHICTHTTWK